MQQRFDVKINTISMASLAEEIIVRDVVEQPEEVALETVDRGNRPGQRISFRTRQSLSVQVIYRIRTTDVVRRTQIRDQIAGWCAHGGVLEINTRPGKRLYVMPNTMPSVNSGLKWTQDLVLTFVAHEQPYWESKASVSVSGSLIKIESGNYWFHRVIQPDGNVEYIPLQAQIVVTGTAPLTWLRIVCEDTMFEFEGLNASNGNTILIMYDEHDRLNVSDITNESLSLLKYRTAQSNDDLLCRAGTENNLTVEADTSLSVQLYTRGRWV